MVKKRVVALYAIAIAMPVPVNASDANTLPSLTGEWTTDCLPIGKNGRHGYVTKIKFADDMLTATSQLYAKNTCQTPTVQVNYSGELMADESRETYIDFSHKVMKITFTLTADDVTAFYNKDFQTTGCGIADWKTNVAMSVAGRSCGPFSFAEEGTVLYDRAWTEGDQLRFGNFPSLWTAISAAQRPHKPIEVVFHRTGS